MCFGRASEAERRFPPLSLERKKGSGVQRPAAPIGGARRCTPTLPSPYCRRLRSPRTADSDRGLPHPLASDNPEAQSRGERVCPREPGVTPGPRSYRSSTAKRLPEWPTQKPLDPAGWLLLPRRAGQCWLPANPARSRVQKLVWVPKAGCRYQPSHPLSIAIFTIPPPIQAPRQTGVPIGGARLFEKASFFRLSAIGFRPRPRGFGCMEPNGRLNKNSRRLGALAPSPLGSGLG